MPQLLLLFLFWLLNTPCFAWIIQRHGANPTSAKLRLECEDSVADAAKTAAFLSVQRQRQHVSKSMVPQDGRRSMIVSSLKGAVAVFITSTPFSAQARTMPDGTNSPSGSAVNNLVPILGMQQEIATLIDSTTTSQKNSAAWPTVRNRILSNRKVPTQEASFKALLDLYSQPVSYKTQFMNQNAFLVYYTQGFDGPGRPSIETDTKQEAQQKRQYGARNDAWIAWDDVVAGASDPTLSSTSSTSVQDITTNILEPLERTSEALQLYLKEASQTDLEEATVLLANDKKY